MNILSSLVSEVPTIPTPVRPNTNYISAKDIQRLFELSKREYNDILVRINKIISNNFIILTIYFVYFKSELRFIIVSLNMNFNVSYKDQDIKMISKIIKRVRYYIKIIFTFSKLF